MLALLALILASPKPPEIDWRPSYAAAIQEAATSDKLVMVDFYNDWWSYCKQMDAVTFADPAVVQMATGFIPVKLNGEKEGAQLAQQYHVGGYPTILFLDKEGQSIGKVSGFVFPEQLEDQVEQIVDGHSNLGAYQARATKNPKDLEAVEKLIAAFARRGNIDGALKLLPDALGEDPGNAKKGLARALNAIGDFYFGSESIEGMNVAASYYQRATDIGKTSAETSYAAERVAQCYLNLGQPNQAVAPLKKALELRGLSSVERAAIQTMLDTAKKESEKKEGPRVAKGRANATSKPSALLYTNTFGYC